MQRVMRKGAFCIGWMVMAKHWITTITASKLTFFHCMVNKTP